MILITLMTKSTPPNEITYINDHLEVGICDFGDAAHPPQIQAQKI